MEKPKEDDVCVCAKGEETVPLHSPEDVGSDKEMGDEKSEEQRSIWDTKCDYVLSLLGYAVGLGNIWRFPYLCYKNGGGAFLVPYFLMLFFVGIPLFLLETAMSQFCSNGGITLYSVCPALMGSGFASIFTNLVVHSYYSVIITYPLLFIYYSFTREVPWGSCGNAWNTADCYLVASVNATEREESKQLVSSADEFFHRKILNISEGIGEDGDMVWHVLGTNLLVWIIVFLCIFKGIRITGKVVWFTATFPILMLLILTIRGVTLPGASDGIHYYLSPDFEKLKEGQVWAAAATQIFYSLGPGWSTVIIMGSYNKFHNNCLKDSVILPILNCSASILAGFVVFSVLGFMAHEMGTTVDKVTAAGPALVFVTYPEALSMMPLAPFWSFLFFIMLFFVGLDSLFVSIEASIASMLDRFTAFRKWRVWVTLVVCCVMFLTATACCTQGGIYVLQLMDWYSSSFCLLCVCLCEMFIFSYTYGAGRTIRDIQMMTNKHVNYLWYIGLVAVTPAIMIMVLVNNSINLAPASYRGVTFPDWAQFIGWTLALIPTLIIPLFLITYCFRSKGSFKQRIVNGFTPSAAWGPASAKNRREWEEYCKSKPLRHRLLHPDILVSSGKNSASEMIPLSSSRNNQPISV